MQAPAPAPSPGAAGGIHYALVVLSQVILVTFSALGLARFGYTSILPAMQQALELSNTQTGMLQSWNLLGYMGAVVVAGVLAARFGPRIVISVSLGIVSAGMLLTGLVPSFQTACLGRFLAGVGGGGSNVPAMALVSSWFGARRRGVAAGAGVAGSSLGLIVTGPLVPLVLHHAGAEGWRVSWYLLAGLSGLVMVSATLLLRNHPSTQGLRAIGESPAERSAASGSSASSFLDWRSVYRSRLLWKLAGIYFGFGFSYIIYSTFFVRYLTGEAGFPREAAGRLWLQVGVVSIVSGFLWGGVSDRWGRRTALLWVFGLQGVAFLLFGLSRTAWVTYSSALLFALTAWSVPALMAALCGDIFGARLAPAALGLITLVFGAGQTLGPFCAGLIADRAGTFAPAFLLAGAVALAVGGLGSLTLHPSAAQAAPPSHC